MQQIIDELGMSLPSFNFPPLFYNFVFFVQGCLVYFASIAVFKIQRARLIAKRL